MKILVCGGRDYFDIPRLEKELNKYLAPDLVIIQGDARGADGLAKTWCKKLGVKCLSFPADWDKYGKRAGYIRNVQMLNEGKPDLVIAFPGGKGTEMMTKLAEAAGTPVVKIDA